MNETALREEICLLAKSLYDRGLSHGSTGNLSVRCSDGGFIVSPTNSSFGFLDPGRLSRLDSQGRLVDGDPPTKELCLHTAFYESSVADVGAVVHLHSHYSVLLSMLPETDPDNMIPPITPYSIMKLGRVKLLPYFKPGDGAMGDAVRSLRGQRKAVVLASHGPVVAGKSLCSAVYAMEELEAAARLTIEAMDKRVKLLNENDVAELQSAFNN